MHGRPPAGPSIAISLFLVAIACSFAGLCYAELASMIPIAGSAYTYSYATLGEIFAWIIGWDLILEYVVSNMAVAVGFAGYTEGSDWRCIRPQTCPTNGRVRSGPAGKVDAGLHYIRSARLPHRFHSHAAAGARNRKSRRRPTTSWSTVKIGAILTFLVVGAMLVKPANWSPLRTLWLAGIVTGGAIVFFTYIGFDSVSTAAEESRNPQKDLPFGIIMSLVVCTLLYVGVAVVLLGMMKYTTFVSGEAAEAPVAYAMKYLGVHPFNSARSIVYRSADRHDLFVARLSVRAGTHLVRHVPRRLAAEAVLGGAPEFQTPHWSTWIACFAVGIPAGLVGHRRCRRPRQHRHACLPSFWFRWA